MARSCWRTRSPISHAVDLVTAYETTPGYKEQQSTLNTQRLFALLIGVLVIGGFFQIQTLQKVPQIGMLKAIGAPNRVVAVAAVTQIIAVTVSGDRHRQRGHPFAGPELPPDHSHHLYHAGHRHGHRLHPAGGADWRVRRRALLAQGRATHRPGPQLVGE